MNIGRVELCRGTSQALFGDQSTNSRKARNRAVRGERRSRALAMLRARHHRGPIADRARGCGLALWQGDLLFAAIFGAACASRRYDGRDEMYYEPPREAAITRVVISRLVSGSEYK
jgi:hypothetical protein